MKEKSRLNTPMGSETHRNELSSGFRSQGTGTLAPLLPDRLVIGQRKNENFEKFISQNYTNFCEEHVRIRDSVTLMLAC
jgi:hypothetical protein